jgi:hypothetical protein
LTRNNSAYQLILQEKFVKGRKRVVAQSPRSPEHNSSERLHSGSVSVHEFLLFAFVPSGYCLIVAGYSGPPFYFFGVAVGALLKDG